MMLLAKRAMLVADQTIVRFRLVGNLIGGGFPLSIGDIGPVWVGQVGGFLQSYTCRTLPTDGGDAAVHSNAVDCRDGVGLFLNAIQAKVVNGPVPAPSAVHGKSNAHLGLIVGLRQAVQFVALGLCLAVVDSPTDVWSKRLVDGCPDEYPVAASDRLVE